MENNAKETNRPLDQEELTMDQEAKIVGGLQVNTSNFNTSNVNTSNFNTSNFNTSNLNTADIGILPKN